MTAVYHPPPTPPLSSLFLLRANRQVGARRDHDRPGARPARVLPDTLRPLHPGGPRAGRPPRRRRWSGALPLSVALAVTWG